MESTTRFTNCEFSNNQAFAGGAVALSGQSNTVFENCVFIENSADRGGALHFETAGISALVGCTFTRNHSLEGAHIASTFSLTDTVAIDHCILAFGTGSEAVYTDETGLLALSCVDIFGNDGGDWTGLIADQETVRGNLSADPLFCGAANPQMIFTLSTDSPCAKDNNPDCGQIGAFPVGCGQVAGLGDPPSMASAFRLLPCYPNPFNPTTNISFELDFAANISLAIYDSSGELVRTLVGGFFPAGVNSATWHGKNNHGQAVASGVYFVRLSAGATNDVQKMVLLR